MGKSVVKKLFIFTLLFSIVFLQLAQAVSPFEEGNFVGGYTIEYPAINHIPFGSDFDLRFHVYNTSDGVPVDNSSTTCFLKLFNQTGFLLFNNTLKHIPGSIIVNEWETDIAPGNFSNTGEYYYFVQCSSSTQGGFDTINFEVNLSGEDLTTAHAIIYGIIMFLLFGLFLVLILFLMKISSKKEGEEKKDQVGIVKKLYFKIFLIGLIYALGIVILNLMVGLSSLFTSLRIFEGTIGFIFQLMLRLAWPVTIILMLWVTIIVIKNSNAKKLINKLGNA